MFENSGRTELTDLGEFGLIDHLAKNVKLQHASTIQGIGDDAAVIDNGSNDFALLSTDTLVEGTHFDLTYTPLKHLGYKAIVANVSDIAAMNGIATHVTVSISFSNRFSLEAIEDLYIGILAACDVYKVDLVGGDTSSSNKGLSITVACYGHVNKSKVAYRKGCQEGDLLVVSGDLGAAYLGLHILEREKRIFLEQPDFKPDLEGNDYLIQRQLKPEARKDVIDFLSANNIVPTSMIDISDGLSSEILHICKNSNVGCNVYEEKIPVSEELKAACDEFKLHPTTVAMSGGEDYELLFTISQADYEKINENNGLSVIGFITEASEGKNIITRGGNKHELVAQGWNHLK